MEFCKDSLFSFLEIFSGQNIFSVFSQDSQMSFSIAGALIIMSVDEYMPTVKPQTASKCPLLQIWSRPTEHVFHYCVWTYWGYCSWRKKKKKGIGHIGFLDLFAFLDLMLSGHVGLSEVLYIAYSHIILSRKFKQNFGLVADSHVVSMFFCGQ